MKIRQGLVSNSSSSSFLLFLDEIPETKEEVKELLFPGEEIFGNPFFWGSEPRGWPIDSVVDIIHADFQNATRLGEEEILEKLTSGWLTEVDPGWETWDQIRELGPRPEFEDKEAFSKWRESLEDLHKQHEKESLELARIYRKTLPYSNVVISVCYGDEDGALYSAIEHGETFRNVEHIAISHH